MVTTNDLGFSRIGAKRELKFALESHWTGQTSRDELKALGAQLRQRSRRKNMRAAVVVWLLAR